MSIGRRCGGLRAGWSSGWAATGLAHRTGIRWGCTIEFKYNQCNNAMCTQCNVEITFLGKHPNKEDPGPSEL